MKEFKLKCTKCGVVIPMGAGFYNYPSGVQCGKCGKERAPLVKKALDDEIKKMAKELKQDGRLK